MSARAVYDPAQDVWRVEVNGEVMADEDNYPLAFEDQADADDMIARRAELLSLPVRPLRDYR